MSVSLEPVDAPETVESEATPLVAPTQIEESESKTTISTDCNTRFRSQGGEHPVEAREPISLHHP